MTYSNRIRSATLSTRYDSYSLVGAHTANATLNTVQTIAVPEGANALMVSALGQNVNFTLDGTAPTATLGFTIHTTEHPYVISLSSTDIELKFIEVSASATLNYQFIRYHS